jgi:pimeloyl-ACP methyl ester carboxylesterase
MISYWDISYNNYNYSYVETAVAQGYSTLAIDRFGIGNSSHGDAINTVQAQAEVEALNEITTKLRHGQVPEIGCSFEKVIHVGHSFGSVQSQWLSALYPNNTDGLVLTGYSASSKFLPTTAAAWNLHSARLNQPLRFGSQRPNQIFRKYAQYAEGPETIHKLQALLQTVGLNFTTQEVYDEIATTEILNLITGYNKTLTQLDYPKGYMATSGATADQYVFFLPGYYDTGLAIYSERTKQPITYGELLTIGSAPKMSTFTGPVFIITGREDQPFCGGDCFATMDNSTSIPAEAKMGFPAASAFEAYIQPDSGHGINLHYNSTAAYKVILTWLGGHGLGA